MKISLNVFYNIIYSISFQGASFLCIDPISIWSHVPSPRKLTLIFLVIQVFFPSKFSALKKKYTVAFLKGIFTEF